MFHVKQFVTGNIIPRMCIANTYPDVSCVDAVLFKRYVSRETIAVVNEVLS